MKIRTILLAGALAGAISMPALAQDQPQATSSGKQAASQSGDMNNNGGAVTAMEKQFVTKAAQGDRAEVQLGQMALQKSNNSEIKQFAQKMIDDHGQNQQQVDSLASKLSITAPGDVAPDQKQQADRLQNLTGSQFDQAYAKIMVQDHRKDVNEFKRAQQSAKNPEIKQYVDQTLPVLQQHLQMAEKLSSKGSNGNGQSGSSMK
jgi:putative membrane protein